MHLFNCTYLHPYVHPCIHRTNSSIHPSVRNLTEKYVDLWDWRHRDLDLSSKITNFIRIRASAINNYLRKTAWKLVHMFGWNFVHWQTDRQTDTYTDKLYRNYKPSTILWRCIKTINFLLLFFKVLSVVHLAERLGCKLTLKWYQFQLTLLSMHFHCGFQRIFTQTNSSL